MKRIIIGITSLILSIGSVMADSNDSTLGRNDANKFLNELPQNNNGYAQISVNQLKPLLTEKEFTLISVHVPLSGGIPKSGH